MAEIATTDYKLGQDNVQVLGLDIHNPVFVVSSLTIVAFVAGVLAFPVGAATAFGALRTWLMSTFDWVFMGAAGNLSRTLLPAPGGDAVWSRTPGRRGCPA